MSPSIAEEVIHPAYQAPSHVGYIHLILDSHFSSLKNPVTLKHSSGDITWGNGKNWVLFAGPDIIEDEGLVKETGAEIKVPLFIDEGEMINVDTRTGEYMSRA